MESEEKRSRKDLPPTPSAAEGEMARLHMVLRHLEYTAKAAEIVAALAEYVPGIEMVSVHRTRLLVT